MRSEIVNLVGHALQSGFQQLPRSPTLRKIKDTGYPHDGRADKDSYPHDRHNQYTMLSL